MGLAQASTGGATQIASGGVLVNGTVNPSMVATTYHFECGLTTSYGTKTTETLVGSGSSDVPVQTTISGLFPGSTYHYRIVATTAAGETDGADQTFTCSRPSPTPPPPPA